MKKFLFVFITAFIFGACNNSADTEKETGPSGLNDATRNFIRAALNGKFEEAKKYMLIDTPNVQYLENAASAYQKLDTIKKEGYAESSIIIHSAEERIKDSVAIVIYSNSFMNNPDTLRVLKQNNNWLVDLKYLYEHDFDTTGQPHVLKDSLQ